MESLKGGSRLINEMPGKTVCTCVCVDASHRLSSDLLTLFVAIFFVNMS